MQSITSRRRQTGVATLLMTVVVLAILSVIVLTSSNVGLFEQKTATNENRQRLADQAAEYALKLGGEYLKANIVNLASDEANGWLASATSHWTTCAGVTAASSPCMAEPNPTRRAQLYYYSFNGSSSIPYASLISTGAGMATMGGTAAFPATATVQALLCRVDTTWTVSGVIKPTCRTTPGPDSANRIAITLIANSALTGEGAAGAVKETWANFGSFSAISAAPLVSSGFVNGTGNVEIVTSPNGAGTGVPVSVWSSSDADVDKTGGGSAASISTCQLGEFLKSTPEANLKSTCPFSNTACGCPSVANASSPEEAYAKNPNFLSGKVPASSPACCENLDILDVDGGKGISPDIQFFPGSGMDNAGQTVGGVVRANDLTDDSLFEWIFGVANESDSTVAPISGTGHTLTNCGSSGTENCAIYDLTSPDLLNAESITCAALNALAGSASGLYYVSDSSATSECDLTASQIGSASSPAIVVVNEKTRLNNCVVFGMLFVRSDNKNAVMRATGHASVYGSVVVEGSTDITGGLTLVYDDTSVTGPGKKLKESTRLARVAGSWLDSNRGGF